MKKSKVYRFMGKLFRYNFGYSVVELVEKATQEQHDDNSRWQSKYRHNLWDIDGDGNIIIDEIGLSKDNWQNREVRNEYLAEWVDELNYIAETYSREYIASFCI